MKEGQHQARMHASGLLSPFLSVFGLERPVEDVALGDVALGAGSAARVTTTKPVSAFPDAANQPLWAGKGQASWRRACSFQGSDRCQGASED